MDPKESSCKIKKKPISIHGLTEEQSSSQLPGKDTGPHLISSRSHCWDTQGGVMVHPQGSKSQGKGQGYGKDNNSSNSSLYSIKWHYSVMTADFCSNSRKVWVTLRISPILLSICHHMNSLIRNSAWGILNVFVWCFCLKQCPKGVKS